MVSSLSGLIPDGFIYLAASPETCMRRMTSRGRGEEGGVSLDYLGSLHSKHEEWLHTGTLRSEYLELLSNPSRYMVRMMKPVPSLVRLHIDQGLVLILCCCRPYKKYGD